MKKTCYVLMLSKTFPATHPRAGELTNFKSKIETGEKIHTIRSNINLWRKRFQKINEDKAFLSVREWQGKPYKSKQIELFQFHKKDGVGIEKIEYEKVFFNYEFHALFYFNNNKRDKYSSVLLSKNDGLDLLSFNNWFNNYPDGEMAIIHFTKIRYNEK